MILEIDMGNTRLKWRIRDGETRLAHGFIGVEEPLNALGRQIESYRDGIMTVFAASVVGAALEQRLTNWIFASMGLSPVFARSAAICGVVSNGYSDPHALGVDRWLGMIAAYRRTESACIVVSCGTAITVDLLDQDGRHRGGYIAPGLTLMLDSLTSGTRKVKLESPVPELVLSPATATSDAVYSACAAMLVGLIDNGARQLHELEPKVDPQMIFTGGDANRLLLFYPHAQVVPDLVLDGLACVLDHPQQLE